MAKPSAQSRLKKIYDQLPVLQQEQLLEYAEFLSERYEVVVDNGEPVNIARPEKETVIAALKRLRETYPMLDQQNLLHETSGHLSDHMMQGKPASEVIDNLEQIFRQQYDALQSES